jgi:hypothetical protein
MLLLQTVALDVLLSNTALLFLPAFDSVVSRADYRFKELQPPFHQAKA